MVRLYLKCVAFCGLESIFTVALEEIVPKKIFIAVSTDDRC